jgi:hypothetical protein
MVETTIGNREKTNHLEKLEKDGSPAQRTIVRRDCLTTDDYSTILTELITSTGAQRQQDDTHDNPEIIFR